MFDWIFKPTFTYTILDELKMIGCIFIALALIYLIPIAIEAIVKLIKRIKGGKRK